jgi:hypothetical protein
MSSTFGMSLSPTNQTTACRNRDNEKHTPTQTAAHHSNELFFAILQKILALK